MYCYRKLRTRTEHSQIGGLVRRSAKDCTASSPSQILCQQTCDVRKHLVIQQNGLTLLGCCIGVCGWEGTGSCKSYHGDRISFIEAFRTLGIVSIQ